jgi:RecA-family ATPase
MGGVINFEEIFAQRRQPAAEAEIGSEQSQLAKLTVRRPSEILAMDFPQDEVLLENGYLAKGDPIAFCGAAGVGKSRLCLQLVIALVTARDFLGWKTSAKGTRWLILQTENGNRRLQSELSAMVSDLTETEKQALDEGIIIHTLENADDSFVSLKLPENEARISALIQEINPTGVIYDVLRDYGIGDLNADEGMTATLSTIGRITRQGNPMRIPLIVHHALTGKIGAARAVGFDRGSFGRNSKVLLGWVRSQINVAPYEPDSNDALIIASAKANNAQEFAPFGARLDVRQ